MRKSNRILRWFLPIGFVLFRFSASCRAELFVGVLDNKTLDSTVMDFSDSGVLNPSFAPGELPEDVQGVAIAPDKTVYDVQNSVGDTILSKLSPNTGAVVTSGGVQVGSSVAMEPAGVTIGPDGFVYVASTNLSGGGINGVFRVNPSTFAASVYLPTTGSQPLSVGNMAFGPDSNLYFVDYGANGVSTSGAPTNIWKYNTTTHALSVLISSPNVGWFSCIAFGPNGNLFLGTSGGVLEYNSSNGSLISTFIANGTNSLRGGATDIAFSPGGSLFVLDGFNEILQYNGTSAQFIDVALPSSALSDGSGGTNGILAFAYVPEPTCMLPILGGIALLPRRFNRSTQSPTPGRAN